MSNDTEEIVSLNTRQHVPPEFAGMSVIPSILSKGKDILILTMFGGPGSGKTTQLWAVQQYCTQIAKAYSHRCHVMSECHDIDRHRYSEAWLEAWCNFPGILCIDDIGYKKPNEWNIQALYAILNIRAENKRKTMVTTNHDKKKITELYGEPIASRLFRDVVIDAGTTDMRGVRSTAQWHEPKPVAVEKPKDENKPYDPKEVYEFYIANPQRIGPSSRKFIDKYEARMNGEQQKAKAKSVDKGWTGTAAAVATAEIKNIAEDII